MHTLLDLHGNIPTFISITDGKVHDVNTHRLKAVAVVTDWKSYSGPRPARWFPHQAGFKK
jgi:hypothetical protein